MQSQRFTEHPTLEEGVSSSSEEIARQSSSKRHINRIGPNIAPTSKVRKIRDADKYKSNLEDNTQPMCVPKGTCHLRGRLFYRLEMGYCSRQKLGDIRPVTVTVQGSKLVRHQFRNPEILKASDLLGFACLEEPVPEQKDTVLLHIAFNRVLDHDTDRGGKSVDLELTFARQKITLRFHIANLRHPASNYILHLDE
jgi:hypothetical protein